MFRRCIFLVVSAIILSYLARSCANEDGNTFSQNGFHQSHISDDKSQDPSLSCGIARNDDVTNDAANMKGEMEYKRVLGGVEVKKDSWPWQALIRYRKGAKLLSCTGVLVSSNIVLTVAQCIPSTDPAPYYIILGEHDVSRYEGNETVHKVEKIAVPRMYNKTTLENDIALIQLKDRVAQTSRVNYICLPAPTYYTIPGTSCFMTGWGLKETNRGLGMARKLQEDKLQVVAEDNCDNVFGKRLPDSQMCASNGRNSSGGCRFDIGSPLVCYNKQDKHWELQGIFSYSSHSCSSNATRYSLFTRISVYSRAIQNMISKAKPTPHPQTTKPMTSNVSTAQTIYSKSKSSTTEKRVTTQKVKVSSTKKTSFNKTTLSAFSRKSTILRYTAKPTSMPVTHSQAAYPLIKKPLRIHLRSEGCLDRGKIGIDGQAYIIVNGIDFSSHKRGHNIVTVDVATGKVERNISFDTTKYSEFIRLKEFLLNIKPRKMLLVAVQNDGSRYQTAVKEALGRFGATQPFEVSLCSSFCLMGYSGPESVTWIRQDSHKRFQGPSEINEVVPLDEETVRIKVQSDLMTNQSNGHKTGRAYIWVDGVDVSRHVDGHNLVTIDFDTGAVKQSLGFHTRKSFSENRILAKLLDSLQQRQIIIIVTQSGNSKYNWMIRKALGNYGASSELELQRERLYAFIGYSGPEKASWTAETRSKMNEETIVLKAFIKKGFATCGLSSRPLPRLIKHVVGGETSEKGHWPWMASIIDRNGKLICGAALINDQWLVTAAHCFDPVTMKSAAYQVVLGSGKYFGEDGSENIEILETVSHPLFDRNTYDFDVAVIKLQRKAAMRDHIRSICITESNAYMPDHCYVSGWGRQVQGGKYPEYLKHANVPIVSSKVCNTTKTYTGKITDRMICAGYAAGGIDACQGDSGGPLSCKDLNGYWHLAGIVSWGAGCAMPDHYGVYTDVNALKDWIFQKINV